MGVREKRLQVLISTGFSMEQANKIVALNDLPTSFLSPYSVSSYMTSLLELLIQFKQKLI